MPTEIPYSLERFNQYVDETTTRLNKLRQFFIQTIPIIENVDLCNHKLIDAGRPDLIIKNKAEFPPITADIFPRCQRSLPHFNNFGVSFGFDRILIKTIEEDYKDHPWKPLQRLLTLFPDFFFNFVRETSSYDDKGPFEPEIYIAYQIISNLVDLDDDKYVRKADGKLDTGYLLE